MMTCVHEQTKLNAAKQIKHEMLQNTFIIILMHVIKLDIKTYLKILEIKHDNKKVTWW